MGICYGHNAAGMMSMYRCWDIHPSSILHRACSKIFGIACSLDFSVPNDYVFEERSYLKSHFLILGVCDSCPGTEISESQSQMVDPLWV